MKISIILLFLCASSYAELPPPYHRQGFRPSPQFTSQKFPERTYGPPSQKVNVLDLNFPSRITIEQLIGITEQLQHSRQKVVNRPHNSFTQPQLSYGPPKSTQLSQQNQNRPINFGGSLPQTVYGPPKHQQLPLQTSPNLQPPSQLYGRSQSFGGSQSVPQNSYGAPAVQQLPSSFKPSNFGSSNINNQFPSTSYGTPDVRNLETFGNIRNTLSDDDILRKNLLNDLRKQHLPYKPPSGFRPQNSGNLGNNNIASVAQQYIPTEQVSGTSSQNTQSPINIDLPLPNQFQNQAANNNNGVGTSYLPPSTTSKPTAASTPKLANPQTIGTTARSPSSTNYDYDYESQPTEAPSTQDESETGPNISISTAVAGAGTGGFFYLQQPDGRLQRVTLQKSQEPNSKPEEFVANYYFQNIPALPNTLYAPLINLGAYVKK
ncbi:uncharacterized protein LOC115891085 isoform X2 [Sitophilus oryzae]|uniref:Uncharacterized protein LOC115891085 isoform X2 n=1 Tax=Sitophilus oryzae TaxID=7048 RepID=A0A6J2YWW5_SITOR|nr:uncharacterized protein LOC115891085 isoform X2 [Sitophilus oryzae]